MGRKSIVAWVVALTLLVSIALRITRTAEPDRAEPVSPFETELAEPVGASSPASSPAPDASTGSTGSAAASDGRSELAQPLTDPVVIAVIDSATGAPVPGALVRTLDARALAGGPRDFEQDAFYEAQLLEHGTRWIADERGEVRVERFAFSGRISAEKDGAWGWLEIDFRAAKTGRWTVAIAPDRSLVVRTLDSTRRPIGGVRVRMRCRDSLGSLDDPTLSAVSDLDGRAVLRHAGAFHARRPGRSWLAHVVGVLDPPVCIDVDATSFGRELELVLPPFGEVDLKILDPSGKPEAASLLASLELADDGSGRGTIERAALARVEGLTDGGTLRVACVGLGLDLHAGAWMPMRVCGRYEGGGRGPTRAGERVELALGGPGAVFALVGRFADGRGDSVRWTRATCSVELQSASGSVSGGVSVPCDEQGRFRLLVAAAHSVGTLRNFRFEVTPPDGRPLRGSLEWNSDLIAPETDVGTIALHGLRLVVAGRVLDETGRPAVPAQVCVHRSGGGTLGPGTRGWHLEGDLRTAVKDDGTFEILGDRELANAGLWIDGSPFVLPDVVPFEIGASDVVLRVARAGRLSGSVRFDAGLELGDFGVVLRRAGTTEWEREHLTVTHVPGLGAFHFPLVRAGTYDVSVLLGADDVLAEVAGVEVVASGADDPRLAEIDVRGAVRAFELCVLDDARKPLDWGSLSVRAGGDDARWRTHTLAFGCARVLTTSASLDVAIELPGFRPVFEPHVTGAREFVLQRGIAVEVELEHPPLPDDALLRVILRSTEPAPDGHPVGWPLSTSTRAQRESRFELVAPVPGRYSVAVELQLGGDSGSVPMFDVTPEPLEIRDVDGQRFRVALDPAVVAEKLAYLQKQR